jgi:hypothetical protein
MIRKLLTIVLPLLVPAVLYVGFVWMSRRRKGTGGEDVDPFSWREAPWLWLGAAGIVLMALTLVASTMVWREKPGGTYEPPRFEEGKRIPGHIVR